MTLPVALQDREYGKFAETHEGSVAVRVLSSTALSPLEYDTITVTYPTATSEVYTYSLTGSPVGVITVTYVDSTKEQISTVVRS